MNEHERFNKILSQIGNRRKLAEYMGMSYESVRNQLAPSKPLPKWAKSILYAWEGWRKENLR